MEEHILPFIDQHYCHFCDEHVAEIKQKCELCEREACPDCVKKQNCPLYFVWTCDSCYITMKEALEEAMEKAMKKIGAQYE